MQTSAYEKALDTAHAEIANLSRQRAELDKRISQLKVTADALTALMDITPEPDEDMHGEIEEPGISDAIRQVLRASPVPLTPSEIEIKLTEGGFDASMYANNGNVIHNTLKHLEQQGDVSLVGSVYLALSL